MDYDVRRTLIESSVRRALGKIGSSPQRSVRNLIDLALASSRSPFQRSFFSHIQGMLQENENSSYFDLAQRIVSEIDTDRLIAFGMNLGYEACVKGAEAIRASEEALGFNIPWMIGISLPASQPERATALIDEARNLGVHSFSLYTKGRIEEGLEIAAQFDDCAFFLFAPGASINAKVASWAATVPQALISILYDEGACYASSLLHSMHLPFGAHCPYPRSPREPNEPQLTLSRMLALKPYLVILNPTRSCPTGLIETVHRRVLAIREEQRYPAIVLDGYSDRLRIDCAISAEPCALDLDEEGTPLLFGARADTILAASTCNVYADGLGTVLAKLFPHHARTEILLDSQRAKLMRDVAPPFDR